MSTTSRQASSTSPIKLWLTTPLIGLGLIGLLLACNNEPGVMTFGVNNLFRDAVTNKESPGLCTGGLRAKMTTSDGTILEIPNVAPGKNSTLNPSPTKPFGVNQTITIEAWCNTGGVTEGYSKFSRQGSGDKIFGATVTAPQASGTKPSYEVTSPGPIITF
jgi:hypothetical protein